jgi:hypothetical protein
MKIQGKRIEEGSEMFWDSALVKGIWIGRPIQFFLQVV